ncbi:O-succinylhomoserine sulfhydrylase [Parasulfuritortus cantonensis]|uniref:O-succinylhomoserine sulfhydrylase n=1 Tax=Parasulfuritortus cantonensis TaxID=2528202 RepID=A0A4R1BMA3_9PROT|nr:O-succinylhomoserine sulfhydrylase [Parasulfuritortus cantonensis]TCJ18549.1 O-succinylhomoserine sulfhydrylase [Parasulfuritortus cantonensis]
MTEHFDPATLALRAGTLRSGFQEHSEAMFLTSSFVFGSAAEAAARFSGAEPGNIYARFTNPTVTMFEQRLAALEGAERCVAFASGMAAVLATVMGLMQAGEHVVASRSLFGSTVQLFANIMSRFGVSTTFVAPTDLAAWRAAVRPETRLFFLESPSNPLTEVSDIRAIAAIAHEAGARLAVDNCFCTPILQRPLELGADIVIHSATKYLDGQGRVLGGAVLGGKDLLEGVYTFLRTAGPTLSAFNAWVLLKGMETLPIRMRAHSEQALALASWLERQPGVLRVRYPGLPSHPQHELAMSQQASGGGILAFEVAGGKEAAWRVIDASRVMSITANLGDVRTTITHPATTTHSRMTPEQRADAGIGDGLIRLAVGLEALADLQADLARGLVGAA